jgi:hypothetical protein
MFPVVPWGRTHVRRLVINFRNFVNPSKNGLSLSLSTLQLISQSNYWDLQWQADKYQMVPVFRTRTFPFISFPIYCSLVISPSELLTALLINKYGPIWTPNYRTAPSCLNVPSSVLGILCHILDRHDRQATLKCWRRV